MRLIKYLLVSLFLLAGCAPKQESLKVLSPTGAPALSLIDQVSTQQHAIDFVTGSEVLSAELVKDNYDIILAPVNLGAKLMEKGQTDYRLAAVITWGNLYLVGSENALNEEGVFASFGEGSVVDFVLRQSVDVDKIVPEMQMYSSAQDVQGALLSLKASCGLLAEPAVSATIQKAKQMNVDLQVLENVQALYKDKTQSEHEGFPQAAIFVKVGSEKQSEAFLKSVEEFVNKTVVDDVNVVETLVDEIGVDTLGVPSAALSKATWDKQNIHFIWANDCQDDVEKLLSLMKIEWNEEMLSK